VYFQKISKPTPTKVNGNSKGEGELYKPNFLQESMVLKLNFQRGWGVQTEKPSVKGVWIFSETAL